MQPGLQHRPPTWKLTTLPLCNNTKEERNHPACYHRTVQKPASLMVCGSISVYGAGSLDIWKDIIDAEQYIEQHLLRARQHLFKGSPCTFQQENAKPQTASITTAWLPKRRVIVLNWSA